jgi:polyketide cyclase/dehydrase/lipid transport protein
VTSIRIHPAASAILDVAPEKAFAVIADYRRGHPLILPRPPFIDLEVERGGVGAGTRIRFRMRSFGQTQTFHAEVSEPQPGRVLVETNEERGVSTFTVTPEAGGRCRVTIETEWSSPAPRGWIERLLAQPFLRKVYAAELVNLGKVAAEWNADSPLPTSSPARPR